MLKEDSKLPGDLSVACWSDENFFLADSGTKAGDFIGKVGALQELDHGGKLCLRTFVVETTKADAIGDEPIAHENTVQGWITSGGFAHPSRGSVAMGCVPNEIADQPDGWSIEILGKRCPARLQAAPLFDQRAKRMRS